MSERKFRGRLFAAVAAVAAVLGAAIAVPAAAAPTVDIDPDAQGSIVVHKYSQPQLPQDAGNGLALDESVTADWTPLGGIEFTATRVPGIDLTTQAGWTAATALTVADAALAIAGQPATADETTGTSGVTLGQATLGDLPLGLYYVQEHLTAAQLAAGITPSAPFLVTVPLTDPVSTDSWLYEVHVYPKNYEDAITKSVDDETTIGVGTPANGNQNNVVWTIDATIPEGGQTDFYRIADDLDPRLTYVPTASVQITGLAGAATQLVPADYTIAATTETTKVGSATAVASHTRVTVTLTSTGLAKIWAAKQANAGAEVQVKITTFSTSVGDGIIPNDAVLFPNQYQVDNNPGGIPSNEVETRLGGVKIQKTNVGGTANLGGAVFAVFLSEADARAASADDLSNAIDIPGQAAGTKTVTTANGTGVAVIDGLRLSNFEDDVELADEADWRTYYLLEVQAPSGYELQTDPIPFTVTRAGAVVDLADLVITNAPHNAGFQLPLTGGIGTAIFWFVGTGVLLIAIGLVLRHRRRLRANI